MTGLRNFSVIDQLLRIELIYKDQTSNLVRQNKKRGMIYMKTMQPTLITYPLISEFFAYAGKCEEKIFLSQHGVIHTSRIECSTCKNICSYNGSNDSGHVVSRSINSFFKKGQQYCKYCDRTFQIENEVIDKIKNDLDQFILSQVISLREFYTSYSDISKHIEQTFLIKISSKTIEDICNSKLEEFDNLEIEYEIADRFYCYDEQWIIVNGKKMLRIVIFDPKNNVPIYEEKHETLTKDVLKVILRKVFKDQKPKGFVFDMLPMYPEVFRSVFGQKIKLQFCVFHLNKLVLDEYKQSIKEGKKVKWTLVHYYNLYTIFNIFYDRTQELDLITKYQKDFDEYKIKIKNMSEPFEEGIKFPKNCKSKEDKIEYLIHLYEKNLMKKIREHLHNDKLRRKREKKTLIIWSKEDAKKNLDNIIKLIQIFPKKIQKRISNIEKNFDLFTASDGEITTNNKLEGFFGVTLKKFRKKGFHSDKGFQNFLTFQKIKQKGIQIIEAFTIQRLGRIFGILELFIK